MKSRSSLLAPSQPGAPGERAVKRICVCVCQKSTGFSAFFTYRFRNEWHMWHYELHPPPPDVINVATLLCESQNRKRNITAGYLSPRKLLQMYHSFIKVDQGHHVPYIYLFGVLYSKVCVKQRFMTLTTCENARCKLFLTLTGTCACWWWTVWMRALTWMFIYMIHQNILWNCQCNLMHVTAIF